MKIKDILEKADWKQDSPDFKTKQTDYNPTTGGYTWDVEYTPLKGVDDNLEDAYQDFKKILKKYPNDDKLEKLFEVFAKFKRQYRMHVTRKYGR